MDPTRQTRDERLARELRAQIFAGQPPVGGVLESAQVIADRRGDMSAAMVQRAFELLRREGLVESEQGRGTYVRERFRWQVIVSAAGSRPSTRALREAQRNEPAVSGLSAEATPVPIHTFDGEEYVKTLAWVMEVEAADVVPAVAVAVSVARATGATGRVAVEVRPA